MRGVRLLGTTQASHSRLETVLAVARQHERSRSVLCHHGVDYFHDIQMMSDHDAVKLARSLEIDIAIDLAGFTGLSRTNIFAMSEHALWFDYTELYGSL